MGTFPSLSRSGPAAPSAAAGDGLLTWFSSPRRIIIRAVWDLLSSDRQQQILDILCKIKGKTGESGEQWVVDNVIREVRDWTNVINVLDTKPISDFDLDNDDHLAALAWHVAWHWGDGGCFNWEGNDYRSKTGFGVYVRSKDTAERVHVGFGMKKLQNAPGGGLCALGSRENVTMFGRYDVWYARLRCTDGCADEVRTVGERLCNALTLDGVGLVDAWRQKATMLWPELWTADDEDRSPYVLQGPKREQTEAVVGIATDVVERLEEGEEMDWSNEGGDEMDWS